MSESHYKELRVQSDPLLTLNVRMTNYHHEFEQFLNWLSPSVVDMKARDAAVGMIIDDDEPLAKTQLIVYRRADRKLILKPID